MPASATRIRVRIMVRLFTLDSNVNDGKLLVLHHEALGRLNRVPSDHVHRRGFACRKQARRKATVRCCKDSLIHGINTFSSYASQPTGIQWSRTLDTALPFSLLASMWGARN